MTAVDTLYASEAVIQGMPGVGCLLLPVPFLAYFSTAGRRLLACAPALVALAAFLIACIASGWTSHAPDIAHYVYVAAMALAAVGIFPSLHALRNKWVALLHLSTFAGVAFLWFVGSMALAHDWI